MVNADGFVLMRFHQEIPKLVRVGKMEYAFTMSHHVSACWIRPEHVDEMLRQRGCSSCGGRQQFYVASEENAKEWLGLSERFKGT